ncbi:TetR family transcriptional regulator [Pseudomonas putida S11]|nr:TetR family transcriptional regulator [Pseudomonas putida S11]
MATCQIQLPDLLFEYPEGVPVEEVLLTIARGFQALISSDEAVKLSRLIMAQGSLDPSFGEYFYEAGPKRVLAGMEALLRGAHERGLLRIDNPLRAAEHFFCLVKGAPDYRLLLGCAGPLEGDEAEAHVREVVGVVLASLPGLRHLLANAVFLQLSCTPSKAVAVPVGAALAANTGKAGAIHHVSFFAGKTLPQAQRGLQRRHSAFGNASVNHRAGNQHTYLTVLPVSNQASS